MDTTNLPLLIPVGERSSHIIGYNGKQQHRMIKAGTLPQPIRLSGRQRAWRRDDLLAWLENKAGGDV